MRGDSLSEVLSAAQGMARSCATLGVACSVCTLPGKEPSGRCVCMEGGGDSQL